MTVEYFYSLWVKAGGPETPFLHDQAMEFASSYAASEGNRRMPESELEVKIAEMINGATFSSETEEGWHGYATS